MLGSPQPHTSLSVSELTRDAKNLLESHFDQVRVEGEIGDFTAASSGHWYFTLKDADSQVRCAMFRGANSRINVRPSKGDNVVIRARVTLYEQRGEFQLVVQHLALAGDGALQLAFEQLKNKLQAEGLFDASRKATLPSAARRVGVITSATGAALHDILSVLGRRSPMTEVVLFPVPVQGIEAPAALCRAIKQANSLHATEKLTLDVLIIGAVEAHLKICGPSMMSKSPVILQPATSLRYPPSGMKSTSVLQILQRISVRQRPLPPLNLSVLTSRSGCTDLTR